VSEKLKPGLLYQSILLLIVTRSLTKSTILCVTCSLNVYFICAALILKRLRFEPVAMPVRYARFTYDRDS
jgi:hypothetical protein